MVPSISFTAEKYQALINCDIHQDVCTQIMSGYTITLDVTPKPVKAMHDLLFRVTLTGDLPPKTKSPYIDLGMPGMNMGRNRVLLKPKGEGTYEGRGVIIRCPSGRKIWRATVTVPDVGQTAFIFNVIY